MLNLLVLVLCTSSGTQPPPHIVFMLGDEIGWNNVGWHSNITRTPRMNQLRKGGVTLDRHYVQRWCAPTRAAIMTGRYPYNTGMNDYNHGIEEERSSVPVSFDMLPKLLKNAPTPYATHMLGKWHLGFFKHAATPVGRGFDSSFGYFCGDSTHDTRGSQESHTCGMSVTDLYNSTHPANTSDFATNRVYNTHMYAELASELIHAHDQTKPFFLYMAFQNAHAPYQAPAEYLNLYPHLPPNKSQQCFNAMVSAVDVSVGVIVDTLTRVGMYNNTILIYSSDNGGPANMSNNMPLRGAKFSVFEGGLRVPAFVHSRLLPESTWGTATDALIYISDWYVTLATLAGVSASDLKSSGPVPPDGLDVWTAVTGAGDTPQAPSPRTMIVHDYDDQKGVYAFRSGAWKVIWGDVGESRWIEDVSYAAGCTKLLPPRTRAEAAAAAAAEGNTFNVSLGRGGGWKDGRGENDGGEKPNKIASIACTEAEKCLFNVVDDPNEHQDPRATAKANPQVMAMLAQQLESYLAGRYTGKLDEASTPEAEYCELIKRTQWVQPYDDGEFPPPPPAPPAPPPAPAPPITPAAAALLNGTWVQNYNHLSSSSSAVHADRQKESARRSPELMAMRVSPSNNLVISPLNCTGCCWHTATGHASADGLTLSVTAIGDDCTKDEVGHVQHNAADARDVGSNDSAPTIQWSSWSSWRKVN